MGFVLCTYNIASKTSAFRLRAALRIQNSELRTQNPEPRIQNSHFPLIFGGLRTI
jgi:hypothetical protein